MKKGYGLRLILAILVGCLVLSGCASQPDQYGYRDRPPKQREANPEKAVTDYINLALGYIGTGNLPRARIHLARAMELDDRSSDAHAAMGLIYQQEAEYRLAENSFRKALRYDGKNTRARSWYGAFLYQQQRYPESLEQLKIAAEDTEYPARPMIYNNLAEIALKMGDREQAKAYYNRALTLSPYLPQGLLGISDLLLDEGSFDQAQYYYQRYLLMVDGNRIRHTPRSLWIGVLLSEAYSDTKNRDRYGSLLKENHPGSEEYQWYKQLSSGD